MKEPHFLDMLNKIKEEDVLAKAPYVAKTSTVGGFDVDRKMTSQ